MSTSAAAGGVYGGDVDFFHGHHGLEGALGLFAAGAVGVHEGAGGYLPGDAPFVFAPAADVFGAVVVDDGVPVAVGFFLGIGGDLEGEGFGVFDGGAAVEAEAGEAEDGEFDHEFIAFFSAGVVGGGFVDGGDF